MSDLWYLLLGWGLLPLCVTNFVSINTKTISGFVWVGGAGCHGGVRQGLVSECAVAGMCPRSVSLDHLHEYCKQEGRLLLAVHNLPGVFLNRQQTRGAGDFRPRLSATVFVD